MKRMDTTKVKEIFEEVGLRMPKHDGPEPKSDQNKSLQNDFWSQIFNICTNKQSLSKRQKTL